MKAKKHTSRINLVHIFLGLLVAALAAVMVAYSYQKAQESMNEVTIIEGVITYMSPPITDTDATMTVNGITLQIYKSGLKPKPLMAENFSIGPHSLKEGDIVEVHYLKTGDAKGTLNCKGCMIKKGDEIFRPKNR